MHSVSVMSKHPVREPPEFSDRDATLPTLRAPRARILVADDDLDTLDLVSAKLRRDGYEVYEAGSGDDTLAMLDILREREDCGGGVDLLVLDVHMPRGSGVSVLRVLRSRNSTIPVVLMTGDCDATLRGVAERLHARVLAKPFSLDHLSEAAIAALLSPHAA